MPKDITRDQREGKARAQRGKTPSTYSRYIYSAWWPDGETLQGAKFSDNSTILIPGRKGGICSSPLRFEGPGTKN